MTVSQYLASEFNFSSRFHGFPDSALESLYSLLTVYWPVQSFLINRIAYSFHYFTVGFYNSAQDNIVNLIQTQTVRQTLLSNSNSKQTADCGEDLDAVKPV